MKSLRSGMFNVGDGHSIYYEQHGLADTRHAVVLHGGPGGGIPSNLRDFFDMKRWTVTAFDQRGCGRSTPFLGLHKNTTWDLVADIERLREHLGVDKWLVFGGSWGSTLALAYASRHPDRVTGLVLRGVCLMEPWETEWMYSPAGAARLRPADWDRFAAGVGFRGRRAQTVRASTVLSAYGRRFRSRRAQTRRSAARAWWDWEAGLSWLEPAKHPDHTPTRQATSLSILEHHYFAHNAWIRPGQLLSAARRFRSRFPVTIVQGAYDLVCPPASAYALHKAIPQSKLILTHAGHSSAEAPTAAALRKATDELVRTL